MTEVLPLPDVAETIPAPFAYRWMAGLYLAPPDAEALAQYRAPEGRALLGRIARTPDLAALAGELSALTGPDSDLGAVAGRLAAAHAAAFLVGGRRGAPPYASVWLSERGLMYQAPARAMTRLLAAADLALPDDVKEPPDHIAFQLNLLAELEERALVGRDVVIAPDAFVRDHIMTWLPRFAVAATGLRNPLLYPALATATLGSLSEKS